MKHKFAHCSCRNKTEKCCFLKCLLTSLASEILESYGQRQRVKVDCTIMQKYTQFFCFLHRKVERINNSLKAKQFVRIDFIFPFFLIGENFDARPKQKKESYGSSRKCEGDVQTIKEEVRMNECVNIKPNHASVFVYSRTADTFSPVISNKRKWEKIGTAYPNAPKIIISINKSIN